ncbi:MAG: HEAT repeat domain-containing protein [Rubripirellula sp.]
MKSVMEEQQKLHSSDLTERAEAAELLAQMGSDAVVAAVDLVQACGDEPEVRDWAVAALEELGPPLHSSLEPLQPLVSSQNPLVAYWAITLLGRAGHEAQACQDCIAKALSSEDASVQERAAWALGKIGASSATSTEALKSAAESSNTRLSRIAAASLNPTSN